MCIICLKPAGVDMPTDEDIKYMFDHNKDGAGYAIQGDLDGTGKYTVRFFKGFMTAEDLIKALGDKEKLKPFTVAIHCRIGTHGYNDKQTTHPFPISDNYADLRKLNGEGAVLFHNGVLTGLGNIVDAQSSDTQDFVVGVATRYLSHARMPGKLARTIVNEIVSPSRMLILYPNKKFPMLRLGEWHEHKGLYYSNAGYRGAVPKVSYNNDHYYGYSYGYGCTQTKTETGTTYHLGDGASVSLPNSTPKQTNLLGEDSDDVDLRCYVSEGYRKFYNDDDLAMWLEEAVTTTSGGYVRRGKVWYIDFYTAEAFTMDGLRRIFGEDKTFDIREALLTEGTLLDTLYEHVGEKIDAKKVGTTSAK